MNRQAPITVPAGDVMSLLQAVSQVNEALIQVYGGSAHGGKMLGCLGIGMRALDEHQQIQQGLKSAISTLDRFVEIFTSQLPPK
jgi:hypothetical protein